MSTFPVRMVIILFDEMVRISCELSKNFNFSRVDLYQVRNKVYFGELTFYPGNGFERFYPDKYDRLIGDYFKKDFKL